MANIYEELLQLNLGSMANALNRGRAIQAVQKDINEKVLIFDKNTSPGMKNILLRLQLIETKQTESNIEIEKRRQENSSLVSMLLKDC